MPTRRIYHAPVKLRLAACHAGRKALVFQQPKVRERARDVLDDKVEGPGAVVLERMLDSDCTVRAATSSCISAGRRRQPANALTSS